jgi:hypothetical protein
LDQGGHVLGGIEHCHIPTKIKREKRKQTNKQTNTHLNILIKKNRFAIKNNQFAQVRGQSM